MSEAKDVEFPGAVPTYLEFDEVQKASGINATTLRKRLRREKVLTRWGNKSLVKTQRLREAHPDILQTIIERRLELAMMQECG